MNRYPVVVIIVALMFLVGCKDTDLNYIEQKQNNTVQDVFENQKNIVEESYDDENHKTIDYGEISFDIGSYHIVTQLRTDNAVIFECTIDTDEKLPQSDITVKIEDMNEREILNKDDIITYLANRINDYDRIQIYSNIIDDSGITSLYSVENETESHFLIFYNDKCYLVQSDYSRLKYLLFENRQEIDYEINKQYLESENAEMTVIENITSNVDKTIEYSITQEKNSSNYTATLSLFDEPEYIFQLKNEAGIEILSFNIDVFYMNETIEFLDVNLDGYIDIKVLENYGTLNKRYVLYVWDYDLENFVKVKCEENLSYFEVNDGYLLNWLKADAISGVVQTLRWEGNSLKLESEESYGID